MQGPLLSRKSPVTSKNVGLFYFFCLRWPPSGNLCKNRKKCKINLIFYLAMKLYKWGIKMTAINSLTHVRIIHTNAELSSKHKRKKCRFFVEKNMWSHPTTDLFLDIIWIISNKIYLALIWHQHHSDILSIIWAIQIWTWWGYATSANLRKTNKIK
jgi:hypothetical protein